MRLIFFAAGCLGLALSATARAAPDSEAQVREAFQHYDDGWRTFNVSQVVDAFPNDFDWVNSVGIRLVKKSQLTHFVTRLFADPAFRAGKASPTEVEAVHVLDANVAVVLSRQRTVGQVNSETNKPIPVLYTDEITVLKRIHGRWLIVSDLSSDEANGV